MMHDTLFHPGQRWTSDTETDLGLGLISSVDGRMVTVVFPASGEQRTYAANNAPLTRLRLSIGEAAKSHEDWEFEIDGIEEDNGLLIYAGTRIDTETRVRLPETQLDSFTQVADARSRLFNGQIESNKWFDIRVTTHQRLDQVQSSATYGLGGARINLIPHQLFIAQTLGERAAPRALLADEVGLGKTIEACLVLHKQLLTGRTRRALIIVPEALLHQWLVELLRRFNLRFKLFDEERCAATQETDARSNPFETEQLVLAPLGLFEQSRRRHEALQSGWDLVIVDEAHHIRWSRESASPEYEFIAGLADTAPGLLLLTATPEQLGEQSHFARLHLLDPERFTDFDSFLREQQEYQEISGIVAELNALESESPPAVHQRIGELINEPVSLSSVADRRELVRKLIDRHGPSRVLFRNTRGSIEGFPQRRVLPCPRMRPEQYEDQPDEPAIEDLIYPELTRPGEWTAFDPRVVYLVDEIHRLKGEKILVICSRADTAKDLEKTLRLELGIRTAVFHEGMSIVARDRAAHYFSDKDGAKVLICSEIGSEGRNFQFAHHLVLFDLPLHPDLLEQRIGRLDRIGQSSDVHIHVPYIANGPQETLFRWYHHGLDALQTTCPVGQSVFEQTEDGLLSALFGTVEPDVLIEKTRSIYQAKSLDLERGRDRLLEISSHDAERAAHIIESIRTTERDFDVARYLERVFDAYGVEYEHKQDETYIVRPSDHMHTAHFPHLKRDGMTVTCDRAAALAHEDVEYLTWEHPMTQGAMELVATGDHGKAVLIGVEFELLPRGSLLIETSHVLEIVAPNASDLRRFVGTTMCRILRNENGRSLNKLLDDGKLFDKVREVEDSMARKLIGLRRQKIAAIMEQNEDEASALFARTIEAGKSRLAASAKRELERLTYLRSVNASVRLEEIELARKRCDASLQSLGKAQSRLDAVRIIVTV